MRTSSSLLLLSLLLSVAAPLVEAAPASRVPVQKGMVAYCTWIKLALKKGETVKPSTENQDKFSLSMDVLTKANALCDAMLTTEPAPTALAELPAQVQQGLQGYCFLIQTALKKGGSVQPSAENADRFNLSIDMLTKADALCDAMLTPPSEQPKGLWGYCLLIDFAVKVSESVIPGPTHQTRFDATVDLLKKAAALCEAMRNSGGE